MNEINKYQKWYDSLIERARTRAIEGYVENHHIIPKCLGGSNDTSNLVKLTAREHLIAHLLLCRSYYFNKHPQKNKARLAYQMMRNYSKHRSIKYPKKISWQDPVHRARCLQRHNGIYARTIATRAIDQARAKARSIRARQKYRIDFNLPAISEVAYASEYKLDLSLDIRTIS